MRELHWVLLGLGLVVVAFVYLAGRSSFSFSFGRYRLGKAPAKKKQTEELIDPMERRLGTAPEEPSASNNSLRERVLVVRVVPKDGKFSLERVVLALQEAGLKLGKHNIFHFFQDATLEESLFSVASLREPGTFDFTNLKQDRLPGLSFFLMLPGPADPLGRFDRMVETARWVSEKLDAELLDERGSSWSIQRERYLREGVIGYCHHQFVAP